MIDDPAPPLADWHPLRPLTAEEIEMASGLVREGPAVRAADPLRLCLARGAAQG